jgi:multiple sugar transport system substrate-binding protein
MKKDVSRRDFLRLVGSAAVITTVAACASVPTGTGTTSSPSVERRKIVVPDTGDPNLKTGLQWQWSAAMEEFTETTGIEVERRAGMGHDQYVALFVNGDSSMDVISLWAAWSAEWGAAGYLTPVDDLIAQQGYNPSEDWVPSTLKSISWDGVTYGLPQFLSVQELYYNKSYFEEVGLDPTRPPQTTDEFIEYAVKLATDNRAGTIFRLQNPDDILIYYFIFLNAAGGELYDDLYNPQINSDESKMVLQFFVDLWESGGMSDKSLGMEDNVTLTLEFCQGRSAMSFGWPFTYNFILNDERCQIEPDMWDVTLIPSVNPKKVKSGTADGSQGFGINQFSQNKEAAWEFLEFFATDEWQKRMAIETGWLPWSYSVLEDPAVQEANRPAVIFQEQSQYPINRFGAPWYTEAQDIIGLNVHRAMFGEKSIDQALDDAQVEMEKIVAKFQVA